ncbi:hypothetical protein SESBI_44229 [Sesbania bispinosa]|nr:hypothetical protein SESBI_44229 [Sesbania bispinosa]
MDGDEGCPVVEESGMAIGEEKSGVVGEYGDEGCFVVEESGMAIGEKKSVVVGD